MTDRSSALSEKIAAEEQKLQGLAPQLEELRQAENFHQNGVKHHQSFLDHFRPQREALEQEVSKTVARIAAFQENLAGETEGETPPKDGSEESGAQSPEVVAQEPLAIGRKRA